MIAYVTIGTNDIARSCTFFDAAFEPLGYRRHFSEGGWAGYGPGGSKDEGIQVYVATPANGEPATYGNGSMLSFKASSQAAVDAFHAAALSAGGKDEGAPGPRAQYDPNFYAAYVRDPEGNKLCAFYRTVS